MHHSTLPNSRSRPACARPRWETIAERWCRSLLTIQPTPYGAGDVRMQLGQLAADALTLWQAETVGPVAAECIGAALVDLGFRDPTALHTTYDIVGSALIADLPAAQAAAMQPRLMRFLGAIAAGFARQVQAVARDDEAQIHARLAAEHQAAETALRAAEWRLQMVVDHLPLFLFACDRAGVIIRSKGSGLTTLGYQPGELVGRSIWEEIIEVPQALTALRRAFAGNVVTVRLPFRGALWDARYVPLRSADDVRVTGVLGIALDITTRVEAEATLRGFELGLTPMELRVLPLLARADLSTYRAIGAALSISHETVRSHQQAIARKLDVPAQRALVVAEAREQGLLP